MNQRVGRSSIRLAQPVCVVAGASIVGKKEGEGPLGVLCASGTCLARTEAERRSGSA